MDICKLSFICSQDWDALSPAGAAGARHCDRCRTDVFSVRSEDEFELHRAQGHCVALLFEDQFLATMGMPVDAGVVAVTMDPILYRPVEDLELPEALRREMKRGGLRLIGDVVEATQVRMLEMLGGSRRKVDTLQGALAAFGLTFGMQVGNWRPEAPP
ncbi:DNA-directed RNA polymerase subunit alpha [Xylophilus ampelinus]|nr:DNA-directed RNA polymerase subunit alpha [Xylophilus ampelinus]